MKAAAPPTLAEVWDEMLRSAAAHRLDNKVLAAWHELVGKDPRVLQEVMGRYGTADEGGKQMVLLMLSQEPSAQVRDFAVQLADAADASVRRDGFALLSQQAASGQTDEVRARVRQALDTEQDPEVLRAAIDALQQPPINPTEAQATAQRLQALAQHADPNVRAESIGALAQWDKRGELMEGSAYRALSDPQPEVRMAAFAAISDSAVRSDRLKGALLGMLGDGATSYDDKARALQALQGFALSADEYAGYHLASVARDIEAQRDAAVSVN